MKGLACFPLVAVIIKDLKDGKGLVFVTAGSSQLCLFRLCLVLGKWEENKIERKSERNLKK